MLQIIQKRVTAGAALLDEKMPGWYKKIDLDSLELSDERHCVLGQLFDEPVTVPLWKRLGYSSPVHALNAGYDATSPVCVANYTAGKEVLGLEHGGPFGFDVPDYEDPDYGKYSFGDLDVAWTALIQERQLRGLQNDLQDFLEVLRTFRQRYRDFTNVSDYARASYTTYDNVIKGLEGIVSNAGTYS
jgi:hypothetical protein